MITSLFILFGFVVRKYKSKPAPFAIRCFYFINPQKDLPPSSNRNSANAAITRWGYKFASKTQLIFIP